MAKQYKNAAGKIVTPESPEQEASFKALGFQVVEETTKNDTSKKDASKNDASKNDASKKDNFIKVPTGKEALGKQVRINGQLYPSQEWYDVNVLGKKGGTALLTAEGPPDVTDFSSSENLEMPDTEPEVTDIGWANAYSAAAKIKEEEAEKAKEEAEKLEAETPDRPQTYTELLETLGKEKPSDYRETQEEKYGVDVDEYLTEKKAIRAEIEALTKDYNNKKAEMNRALQSSEDKMAPMTFIRGEKAKIQKTYNIELNRMSANINAKSAQLAAVSQDFAEAQNFVDKAVDAYTKELQWEYQVYSDFITANENKIAKLDQEHKDALDDAMNLKFRQYEETKAEKKQIGQLMLQYPNSGITLDDTLEEATEKAQKAAGAQPDDVTTSILELDGKKTLINAKTGEIIKVLEEGGTGNDEEGGTGNDFDVAVDYAIQQLTNNPNMSDDQLLGDIREGSDLSITEVRAAISEARNQTEPELYSVDWFRRNVQQSVEEGSSADQITDYLIDNFDIKQLFKAAKEMGYAKWYTGKRKDIKRLIEALM